METLDNLLFVHAFSGVARPLIQKKNIFCFTILKFHSKKIFFWQFFQVNIMDIHASRIIIKNFIFPHFQFPLIQFCPAKISSNSNKINLIQINLITFNKSSVQFNLILFNPTDHFNIKFFSQLIP